jgi:hypothetical protein
VKKALEDMRRAGSTGSDPEAAARSAREASRNLQQALRGIDRPQDNALADTLEDMQRRSQRMARDQEQNESALYEAVASIRQQPGRIDPKQLESLVDTKRNLAEEVSELQKEMRDALNEHRKASPQAARKLAEALGDLENYNLKYRLERSANNLRSGSPRAVRESAAGEGIITEAMDNLKEGLRDASVMASKERSEKPSDPGAKELLSDLAELRRSLREAQGGSPGNQQSGTAREQQDGKDGKDGQGDPNQRGTQEALAQNSPGERNGKPGSKQTGETGTQTGGNSLQPNRSSRTPASGSGLSAWDLENRGSFTLGPDEGRLRRDTNRVIDQINTLTNRMKGQHLSAEEISALRRQAYELRRLAGDPVADKVQAMSTLLDQIELATLAAVEKAKNTDAPRATVQSEDSAAYRETVAEYYRRLGGK